MASNFRIDCLKKGEMLHLKLKGYFDGSSAHELMHAITENCVRTRIVKIDTELLSGLHPFGVSLLQRNLRPFRKRSLKLVFTGCYAPGLASRGEELAMKVPERAERASGEEGGA